MYFKARLFILREIVDFLHKQYNNSNWCIQLFLTNKYFVIHISNQIYIFKLHA